MNKKTTTTAAYWLAAAFAAGFFAVGFPYWRIPYAQVSLPDALYGAGLLVVAVLAAAARAFAQARLISAIFVVGAAVPPRSWRGSLLTRPKTPLPIIYGLWNLSSRR